MAKNLIFPCSIIFPYPSLPTLVQHWTLSSSWWQHKVNLELHWLFSESFSAVSPLGGYKRPSVAQGRTVTPSLNSCHFWWETLTCFPWISSFHEVWLKKGKLSSYSWRLQVYYYNDCLRLHGLGWLLTICGSCGNSVHLNPMCCLGPHPALWPQRSLLCWATEGTTGQLMLKSLLQDLIYLLYFPAMICCFRVELHKIFKANSPLPFFPPRNTCYLFFPPSQKNLGHTEKLHQQQFLWAAPWFPPEAPQLWMTQGNILLVILGKFKPTWCVMHDGAATENDDVFWHSEKVVSDWCRCSGSLAQLQHLLFWVVVDFQIICK